MSYTLAYTGTQIDNILGRSAPNGEFDGYFADINDKLDKLNIVTTSDDYATVQAYVQNNVAVALSDGGKFYVYTGEYDGNYYFACVTQGSSDTTDAVFEVAYIDSGDNWYVGNASALAPIFSPNFTGNPTAPTPTQSSNNTKIATTAFVHSAVDPVSNAALNAYPTDTASGDVVSITDGADGIHVKSFTGSIVPIQDLHGYDNPWVGGAGKNKLHVTATTTTINDVTFTVNSDGTVTVNGTASATASFTLGQFSYTTGQSVILSGSIEGGGLSTWEIQTTVDGQTYRDNGSGVTITPNSNGTNNVIIVIRNGATLTNKVFKPMIRLSSVTDATFAPYSNICPISGWTGANITRAGKNLLDWNNRTWVENKYINASGQVTDNTALKYFTDYLPIKPSTTYSVTGNISSNTTYAITAVFFDKDGNFLGRELMNTAVAGAYSDTFTTPNGCSYVTFNAPRIPTYTNFQVEEGSTATAYEAYNGDTILLSFGETVYAGTLTALGGGLWKIQPTHAYRSITSADVFAKSANAQIQTGRAGYYLTTSNQWLSTVQKSGGDGNPNGVSILSDVVYIGDTSAYDVIPSQTFAVGIGVASGNTNLWFNVDATTCPDVASFKTYLDSLGMHICYPLATLPDPIIVSASDLQTLLGANTVWTDVGAITGMTYRADTALYIDKKLGA